MMGDERVTRRELLQCGATLGGSIAVGTSVAAGQVENSSPGAWVLKPDETEIGGKRGTIERSIGSTMSLCTVGQEYRGRTCDGQDVQLLVPSNATQPTVGATYRFEPSDRENSCDETFMELSAAFPCQRAAGDAPGSASASDSSSESGTDATSADEPSSGRSTPDSEASSTTTTESTPTTTQSDTDSTPATPGSDSDDSGADSDTTESNSDTTEADSDTTESNSDTTEADSDTTEADSDTTDSDASESGGERQKMTSSE